MTVASPLPLVFSSYRGIETFSLDFTVEIIFFDGTKKIINIDAEKYNQFEAPYNFRNVYGAAFSYGAALTNDNEKKMVDSVFNYGFCNPAHLAKIFSVTKPISKVTTLIQSKRDGKQWTLSKRCGDA